MRPIVTMLAAIGLAVVAVMAFMDQQWLTGTAFLAGALAVILPALVGQGVGDLADADLMIRFVRNPVGTVVDETLERLDQAGEAGTQPMVTPVQAPQTFDPDAALARYMARRESEGLADISSGPTGPVATPARTFGRKQI